MSPSPTNNDRMTGPEVTSAAAFERLRMHDKRVELVRGRLVVREPEGARHGAVANEIAYRLTAHVKPADLGRVYAAETGFKLASNPDTVRAPDAAFVTRERLPDPDRAGFSDVAPDLVVEVLSPADRPGDVLARVADWLNAGCHLVWVIDPQRRLARIYRDDGTESLLSGSDRLTGEAVLPGFSCRLDELW